MSISTPEVKMGRIETPIDTRKTVTLSINVKKFMPNLLWVLSARSTDDNRDVLKYLNIDNNGFCCTDGRRLHLCSDVMCLPNGLEHGLYQVNICKDVIVFIPKDGTFPDYKAVIFEPETEPITLNFDFTKYDVSEKSVRYSTSIVKISQILNGESTVNIDFLKDMAGFCWKVYGKDNNKVKFVAGINTAIMMGLRMKD